MVTRKEAEQEFERQKWHTEWEEKIRAKHNAAEAKLAHIPEIELTNEAVWKKFKDSNRGHYGTHVVVFTERWARFMQRELANGKQIEKVAKATYREADVISISPNMYSCAVHVLSQCWKYGDELLRWHNLNFQIKDE